jgi:hypothetical protein
MYLTAEIKRHKYLTPIFSCSRQYRELFHNILRLTVLLRQTVHFFSNEELLILITVLTDESYTIKGKHKIVPVLH